MNKHLGHLLVLAALVCLGNGLGGGAGGTGAGSAGGYSIGGAGGSNSDSSRSGLVGGGERTAPKNATLVLGSSGGGGAGGSAGGSGGLTGRTLSGGPGLTSAVGTTGGSNRIPGSSDSTRSPPSATSGPSMDLTGGFGTGHGDVGVPGGGPSHFGGFGSDSMFDNFPSGFDSPSGGEDSGTGGSADGAGGFNGDPFSGGEHGFGSGFGTGWGSNGRPESSFPTRGSSFGEGRPGSLGAWSSGGNPYAGEGALGGGNHGFGDFNGASQFGNFESGFEFPTGIGGGLGTDERGSGGRGGVFSAPLPGSEPGEFFGSGTGHGGSLHSSSGYVGSSTGESATDFGNSYPDSSNRPGSSLAQAPGGSEGPELLPRLWSGGRRGRGPFGIGHRRPKADPRVAAAAALGALAGVAALGSLGAGIAALVHSRRRNVAARLGGRRRVCVSGDCRRKKLSIPESKVPADILDRIPMNFERL